VVRAFAEAWAETGTSISVDELADPESIPEVGDVALRILADAAFSTGAYRSDTLVTALAGERLLILPGHPPMSRL
jgi:hypothetical protein